MHLEQTRKELPLSSPEGNSEIKVKYFQELNARENGEIWYKDKKANIALLEGIYNLRILIKLNPLNCCLSCNLTLQGGPGQQLLLASSTDGLFPGSRIRTEGGTEGRKGKSTSPAVLCHTLSATERPCT